MAWMNRHPNVVTWAVLAVGMLAIVGYSARDVDTLAGRQWFWLAFTTVMVAGICAWIISWEADEDNWDEDDGDADNRADEDGPLAADRDVAVDHDTAASDVPKRGAGA